MERLVRLRKVLRVKELGLFTLILLLLPSWPARAQEVFLGAGLSHVAGAFLSFRSSGLDFAIGWLPNESVSAGVGLVNPITRPVEEGGPYTYWGLGAGASYLLRDGLFVAPLFSAYIGGYDPDAGSVILRRFAEGFFGLPLNIPGIGGFLELGLLGGLALGRPSPGAVLSFSARLGVRIL